MSIILYGNLVTDFIYKEIVGLKTISQSKAKHCVTSDQLKYNCNMYVNSIFKKRNATKLGITPFSYIFAKIDIMLTFKMSAATFL